MTVEIKSHILRRDEKGLFGIPFKRLLAAGMTGGLVLTLTQNLFGGAVGLALAAAGGLGALVMTASRGGIPFWRRVIYSVRAHLLVATLDESSPFHFLARSFELSPDQMLLDAATLFSASESSSVTRLTDWPLYRDPTDPDHGLTLLDKPPAD